MTKSIRLIATALASLALLIGVSTVPAQAATKTITRGAYKCTVDVYKPAMEAEGRASACVEVQVYIKWNNYGTNVYSYGAQAGYSRALSGTSTVLGRGVRAQVGSDWSGWSTY